MSIPTQSVLFCTDEDVQDLLTALGVSSRTDDDGSGEPDGADEARVLLKARNVATARVKFHLQPRYEPADLTNNWLVNHWATALAALQVCRRGGQTAPASVEKAAKEALDDLKEVRSGVAHLPDVGTASVDWPAWSNITVDPRYRVRQARVQRGLSERTPTQHGQATDWSSEVIQEI